MAKKEKVATGLYLVAIVGIVAVVSLVVLVLNSGGSSTTSLATEDLAGEAKNALNLQSLVSKQAVLNMLNECDLHSEGDNDHLVDYTTFSNDGSGVCNTICNDVGKTCIAASALFFDAQGDYDITTIPIECDNSNDQYRPFDEVEDYFSVASCTCCSN